MTSEKARTAQATGYPKAAMKSVEFSKQELWVRPLLDHLASENCQANEQWREWRIARINGGWNNLIYRATSPMGDVAIKFTIRDWRDRAGREYGALHALQQAGLAVAPEPILLDRTSYAQPVIVQTWIEGEVSDTPPTTEAEWRDLLQHLATVHTLTPDKTNVRLPKAVINANHARDGRRIVREQLACVPRHAQPESLRALVRRFEAARFPGWADAPRALCRVDLNISNFIRCPDKWVSVDWENGGWGDPAFDVANLMTHVAFKSIPLSHWDWAAATYCSLVGDDALVRIQVYYKILLVWWTARMARYLYQVPRGLDTRLVTWSEDRQANMAAQYEHYVRLAQEELS